MRSSVPSEAVSVYNNALNLSNSGEYDGAIGEYTKAISIHPKFIEAYNNMGEIYSKIGDTDRAISSYLQALSIDRNYRVLLNLGVEYFNKGQLTTALSHFNESVKNNDDFLEGHFYTGLAYFNIKEYGNSEKHFVKVISFDKGHYRANFLLSYIYYERKEYRKVLECLDRLNGKEEDKSLINRYYGFCHFHLGNYKEAVNYLTVALESNLAYSKFYNYLKSVTVEAKLAEIGDIDKAIRELEAKMKKETPTFPELSRLSMLYVFKGEYRKAEILLSGKIQ
jgi:tetratricopeptide (TPR) repeat protein